VNVEEPSGLGQYEYRNDWGCLYTTEVSRLDLFAGAPATVLLIANGMIASFQFLNQRGPFDSILV